MLTDRLDEEAIFKVAVEIPNESLREKYLRKVCGDDASLLSRMETLLNAHFEAPSFLESPPSAISPTVDLSISEQPGAMIGPYKIREQIGEGGFGVVYVAEQEKPIARKVALKIIKPGMDTKEVVARFAAEQQALGLMNHPNVAKVLDAGATETGRPYFVMELVYGCPITDFCDQQRLSNRERLELFLDVCRAVQHAHQKGIIHRDIKPSNVMVTMHDDKPVPKVIDFGVAKALSRKLTDQTIYTAYHHIVGTPLYMSPEQAQMSGIDIDTRSDVYSLGVLLYELLTGTTPFDKETLKRADIDELRRIICETEPPRPSDRISTLNAKTISTVADKRKLARRSVSQDLRGELDWIVMRALEKDRNRRYESPSALAADIERYLHDEPVTACPPSLVYRCGKFIRRNKANLAPTAAGLLLLLLLVGVGGWYQHYRGTQQTELNRSVGESLAAAEAVLDTGDYTAVERHLAEARTRLDVAQYSVGPLRTDILNITQRLSGRRSSEEQLQAFQKIRQRVHSYMYAVSPSMRQQAREDCRHALDLFSVWEATSWKDQPGYAYLTTGQQAELDEGIVELLFVFGRLQIERGRGEREAARKQTAYQRAIESLEKIETHHRPVPSLSRWIAEAWRGLGDDQRAQAAEARADANPPVTALDYYVQGEFHAREDDWEPALDNYWKAINRDPRHFLSLLAAGLAMMESEDYAGAEHLLTGAIALNPDTTLAYLKRGSSRLEQGKIAMGQFDLDRAKQFDPKLASSLRARGFDNYYSEKFGSADFQAAITDFSDAIRLDPTNAFAWGSRGNVYNRMGEYEKARDDLTESIRLDPKDFWGYFHRARSHAMLKNPELAKADYLAAILTNDKYEADNSRERYACLGIAYNETGQLGKAIAAYTDALRLEPKDPTSLNNRALAYKQLGRLDEALADVNKAIQLRPNDAFRYNTRAQIEYDRGEFIQAIADCKKAVELAPEAPKPWVDSALAYIELGEIDKAVIDCNNALRIDSEFEYAYYVRGVAHQRKGEEQQALAEFTKAIRIAPYYSDAYRLRGESYFVLGQFANAEKDFTELIRLDPKYAQAYVFRGSVYQGKGELEKALADFSLAQRLDPNNPDAVHNLGWCKYMMGNYQEALKLLENAIDLNPKSGGSRFIRGIVYLTNGQHAESVAEFDTAIDLETRPLAGYFQCFRARAHVQLDDLEAARQDLAKAEERAGESADALGRIAHMLATFPDDRLRDAPRALVLAKKAIELAPENYAAWNALGIAKCVSGDSQGALEAFTKAKELGSKGVNGEGFFAAIAHARLGNADEARRCYDVAAAWVAKNAPGSLDHPRFRDVAAKVLGINPSTTETKTNDE